jgi:plastocyanin
MRTHRYSLLGAVVVVVAALTGGCGGYGGGSKKASSTAAPASSGGTVLKTVTVHEKEYKLTPDTIALAKPGTYVFKSVNDGTTTHSLAVQGNGVNARGSDISTGQSGTLKVTLPKKGTYQIFCPIDGHKGLGMQGTITVGGAGAAGGTSTGNMNTGTSRTTTYSTGY